MLTQSQLNKSILYSLITGKFYWLNPPCNRVKKNSIAGTFDTDGYLQIQINGKKYLAHRLAWFCVTGEWPENEIDHKNAVRSDNSWINLQDVSRFINMQNKHKRAVESGRFKGVHWSKCAQKWVAQIGCNGKNKHLGCFDTQDAAYAVRKQAEKIILNI